MGKINKIIYDVAILILLFLTVCLCSTKMLFLLGGRVDSVLFVLSLFIAIELFCFIRKGTILLKIGDIILFGIIMASAIFISGRVFDISYDGMAYHEMAIGLLKNGWNPIKMGAEEFVRLEELPLLGNVFGFPNDYYADAKEVIGSVIYSFTGYIETAKSVNILAMLAVFGISNFYISKFTSYRCFNYMISLLLVANPITLGQLFTNYVDGLLMLFLELGVLAWFIIIKSSDFHEKRKGFFLLFCSILFCGNIKVSGLFFIGVYSILFYSVILVKSYYKGNLKEVLIKITSILASMVIVATCLIGFFPYITNCIKKGNPIYPLMGKDKVDILSDQQPLSFQNLSNVKKLVISLFSKVDNMNINVEREPEWKIPFSIWEGEIQRCSADTRISGFGPWFSGILIVAVIYFIFYIGKKIMKKQKLDPYAIVFMAGNVILMLFFTGNWWARLSAFEYFFALGILFLMEFTKERKLKSIVNGVICLLILSNSLFFCYGYKDIFAFSNSVRVNLRYLAEISKDKQIEVNLLQYDLSGAQFNLQDYGIRYTISEENFSADGIYAGYTYRIKE